MRYFTFLLFLFTALTLAAGTGHSQTRKWTDTTGKHSVEAELVQIKGDRVILKKRDGEVITVPLARLSESDRAHVWNLSGLSKQPRPGVPDRSKPPIVAQDTPDFKKRFGRIRVHKLSDATLKAIAEAGAKENGEVRRRTSCSPRWRRSRRWSASACPTAARSRT